MANNTANKFTADDGKATGNKNFKKASAFLNFRIAVVNGTSPTVKLGDKGIPLYADNAVHKALIDAMKSGALTPETMISLLTAELHEVPEESDEPIQFGFAAKP